MLDRLYVNSSTDEECVSKCLCNDLEYEDIFNYLKTHKYTT